jgi:hypothetical protein
MWKPAIFLATFRQKMANSRHFLAVLRYSRSEPHANSLIDQGK